MRRRERPLNLPYRPFPTAGRFIAELRQNAVIPGAVTAGGVSHRRLEPKVAECLRRVTHFALGFLPFVTHVGSTLGT